MILFLLACPPRNLPPAEVLPLPPADESPTELVAGEVIDGRFVDGRHSFSMDVPEGWQVQLWPDSGALRVSLEHEVTGAKVEAWAFDHRISEPAPHGSCSWTFTDAGTYREVLRPRLVATCTPSDPADDRISAYLLDQGGMTWQLELHLPVENLSSARVAGEEVLATISL